MLFSSSDCRLSKKELEKSTITAANRTTAKYINDLYENRGSTKERIVRSFLCSTKGLGDAFGRAKKPLG